MSYLKIANELNLFVSSNNPGSVLFKPNGAYIYEQLRNYILKKHKKYFYKQVQSPCLIKSVLLEQSGHMDKYEENIFKLKEEDYCLRPMSCPNHIEIYMSENRSYNNLPLKLFEFGQVFRNESSGALQSLFRARQFIQDDSHVFVAQDNLLQSISDYLNMAKEVYEELGFNQIDFFVSLRPDKRFGDDSLWDKSENLLKQSCEINNIPYSLLENSGAFYGPKIEIQVKDKLNRSWQLGVIQLDYVLPQRFNLKYLDKDNIERQPVILHHAVLGSIDRMIGVLLESFGYDLPDFLHPYENIILSVSQKYNEYAQNFYNKLSENKDNIIIDLSDEKLGKKIAKYKSLGAVNIFVVGQKEEQYFNEHNIFKANLNKRGNNLIQEFIL